jgi:hypothetical protein
MKETTTIDGSRVTADDVRTLPTKELIAGLMEQGRFLIKEEIRLAKTEIRSEAKVAGASAGAIGAGGVIAHTGWLVLAAAVVILLNLVMPLWAAALLVAVAFIVVGGVLAKGGITKLKRVNLKPEETVQTLQEDKQWLKETMRGATSRAHAKA